MAQDYQVTGVTYGEAQGPDGSWHPTVNVAYTTTTTPPVSGTVTVDAGLVREKARYAKAVAEAIQAEVDGHKAVLGL